MSQPTVKLGMCLALAALACGCARLPFPFLSKAQAPTPRPASALAPQLPPSVELPFVLSSKDDYVVRLVIGTVTCSRRCTAEARS